MGSMSIPTVMLSGGLEIPVLGFGLYKVASEDVTTVVADALDAGFRLFDSAEFYGTESETAAAIGDRDDVVVHTKYWGEVQSYDGALRAFDASEAAFGVDRIGCYMIHWPRPSQDRYVEVWRALIRLRDEGRVPSIGVANFKETEIRRLGDETGVLPAINQVELQPWLPQIELREFHAAHGIVTQAWSPLARGRILGDPVLTEIARVHGTSTATVVLAWHLALGHTVVAKTVHPDRMRQNLAASQLQLTTLELDRIATLENGTRTGTHPKDRQ